MLAFDSCTHSSFFTDESLKIECGTLKLHRELQQIHLTESNLKVFKLWEQARSLALRQTLSESFLILMELNEINKFTFFDAFK